MTGEPGEVLGLQSERFELDSETLRLLLPSLDDIIQMDAAVTRVESELWLDSSSNLPVRLSISAWGDGDDPAFSLVATFDEFDSPALQVRPPT